jgi:hypothetical protein
MTFSKLEKIDETQKMHRVLIEDMRQSDDAHEWCKENLFADEWTSEVFDNFDCFYFTDRTMCSIFMFIHGGHYIEPSRGSK